MKLLVVVIFIILLISCVQVVVEPVNPDTSQKPTYTGDNTCKVPYSKIVIPRVPVISLVCEAEAGCVEQVLVDYINEVKIVVKEYNASQEKTLESCYNSLR